MIGDPEDPVIPWPRANRKGKPLPAFRENTQALLDAYFIKARYNEMRHSLDLRIPRFNPSAERRENATLAHLLDLVSRHGLSQPRALDHLQTIMEDFHPVRDWIASAPWDGVDRVAQLLSTVVLADDADEALCGLLMTRWLVSCARAVMPEKAGESPFTPQGVLVFQGAQGIGKTEWVKALAPPLSGWVLAGRTLDPHDRDSVEQAVGHWIVELGELDGSLRKADIAALKAWITQPFDVFRPAYARRPETFPRRTVMAGSVNPRYYLVDDTGNRRWWTIPTVGLNWQHGIDPQQLWAQVAARVVAGDRWWLDRDETAWLARGNVNHEAGDPLIADLWSTWRVADRALGVVGTDRRPRVPMGEIWQALPGRANRPRTRVESASLATVLREAGAEHGTKTHGTTMYAVELVPRDVPQYRGAGGDDSRYGGR